MKAAVAWKACESLSTADRFLLNIFQTSTKSIPDFSVSLCRHNLFNWTVPWMSAFGLIIVAVLTLVSLIVPASYLFLAVGIWCFTHSLRGPESLPVNFLMHVPNDFQLQDAAAWSKNMADADVVFVQKKEE